MKLIYEWGVKEWSTHIWVIALWRVIGALGGGGGGGGADTLF